MVNPSEGLSNKYFGENDKNANKKEVLWDINKNNKLEVEEIEQIISTDLTELQSEIDDSVISDEDLKTTKEKFMKNFQTARYVNMRPSTRTNLWAMNQENFLNELKNLWELDIDWKSIDVSKITDPYLGVKILLSYLWYTWIDWNKLDLTNTSYYPGRILPEQKDLYIALLKFQNLNYWEESKPQSSYLWENKDEGTEWKADGIIWGLTLRWLIQDAKNKNVVKPIEEVKVQSNWSNIESDNNVVQETVNSDIDEGVVSVKLNSGEVKIEDNVKVENSDDINVKLTYSDGRTTYVPKLVQSDIKSVETEWGNDVVIEYDNWEKVKILDEYKDRAVVSEYYWSAMNESVTPQVTIDGFPLPKVSDIYSAESISEYPEYINEYLFTLADLKIWEIENIEYVPLMYKSMEIESGIPDANESPDLKKFIGLWMQQMDHSITQLKSGISVDFNGEWEVEDWESSNTAFNTVEQQPDWSLLIKFTDQGINEIFTKVDKNWETLLTRNGKFQKEIKVWNKKYSLEFATWDPAMLNIYRTGKLDNYEAITTYWLRYLGSKSGLWIIKDKDDFIIKYSKNFEW